MPRGIRPALTHTRSKAHPHSADTQAHTVHKHTLVHAYNLSPTSGAHFEAGLFLTVFKMCSHNTHLSHPAVRASAPHGYWAHNHSMITSCLYGTYFCDWSPCHFGPWNLGCVFHLYCLLNGSGVTQGVEHVVRLSPGSSCPHIKVSLNKTLYPKYHWICQCGEECTSLLANASARLNVK